MRIIGIETLGVKLEIDGMVCIPIAEIYRHLCFHSSPMDPASSGNFVRLKLERTTLMALTGAT